MPPACWLRQAMLPASQQAPRAVAGPAAQWPHCCRHVPQTPWAAADLLATGRSPRAAGPALRQQHEAQQVALRLVLLHGRAARCCGCACAEVAPRCCVGYRRQQLHAKLPAGWQHHLPPRRHPLGRRCCCCSAARHCRCGCGAALRSCAPASWPAVEAWAWSCRLAGWRRRKWAATATAPSLHLGARLS